MEFKDFGALCQQMLPLIKDNEYIFKNCGPNSGAAELGELRTDLTLWNSLKRDVIVPNNHMIKELVERNGALIPERYREVFNSLLLHIAAFEAHVGNPDFDYSQHRFPKNVVEIVTEACYNRAKDDRGLRRMHRWLSRRLASSRIGTGYLTGSVLLYPRLARDVDLVLLSEPNAELKELETLKFDFKLKFRRNLHVTFFNPEDCGDYRSFLDRNHIKMAI